MTWHPLLIRAFAALDEGSIRWCLLREPSCPSAPTGDVDILLDGMDRNRAEGVLAASDFTHIPHWGGPDQFYLCYDSVSDRWIWLHITSEVSFGNHLSLKTKAADGCIARRILRDGTWHLGRDDEFWVTLLHILFDKRQFTSHYEKVLSALAPDANWDGPMALSFAAACPLAYGPQHILEAARLQEWNSLLSIAPDLDSAWRRRGSMSHAGQSLAIAIWKLKHIANPWKGRGLSVALLGPDGAGKSTLARALSETFFFGCHEIYMNVRAEELTRVSRLRIPGLTFLSYVIRLWLRLLTAWYYQARGMLVVFDRYTYDSRVTLGGKGTRERLARSIIRRAFPDVDLALVLDVPGDTMFLRKGERVPEELEAERQRLLALARTLSNAEVLDGQQPPDSLRREATARIWARYALRWSH